MRGLTRHGHRHGEAFCLMTYATDDGGCVERIWNSRDGVTPFIIHNREGREMRHINWRQDDYRPDYKPQPGERIFTDLTPAVAEERARALVERYWDDPRTPISRIYPSKVDAVASAARFDPGDPMLQEVEGA